MHDAHAPQPSGIDGTKGASARLARIGLGTVQFGLDYGISNPDGRTPESEVRAILRRAAEVGIKVLDTASAYGTSEQVLGRTIGGERAFKIVTKTPHLSADQSIEAKVAHLNGSFARSLENLATERVYGLLIHDAGDLLGTEGARLYEAMEAMKAKGQTEHIGVSVYDADQIDRVMAAFPINLIQLPLNLLDQRLVASGHLRRLKERGVEIHTRSAFLQGALLMPPDQLPEHFAPVKKHLKGFHTDCQEANTTPLAASLDYVLSLPEVDCALVGVCSLAQLDGVVAAVLHDSSLGDYAQYAWPDEQILNPSLWPPAKQEQTQE